MNGPSRRQRHLLRRSLWSWLLVRLLFAIALLMTLQSPLPRGGLVAIGVVVLTAAVALLDTLRARERVFLANLGLSFPALVRTFTVTPVLAEVALMLLLP